MDFLRFIVANRWIDQETYLRIRRTQNGGLQQFYSSGTTLGDLNDFTEIRPTPVGDILKQPDFSAACTSILRKARANDLADLLGRWYEWHLSNQEPISTYSMESEFTKRLYERQLEKRAVGHYLAEHDGASSIVHDGDCVIIPEGTSSFYAALSIVALRSNLTIVTSNLGVVREFSENSALSEKALSLRALGGEVNRASLANHVGPVDEIFTGDPQVTVVVSSVEHFSPVVGPCAPDAASAGSRCNIIEAAIEKEVRRIVFICDYTKLCKEPPSVQIITKWPKKFVGYPGRVDIVTCPPPALREAFVESGDAALMCHRYGTRIPTNGRDWREYETIARELYELAEDTGNVEFHEAFELVESEVDLATT